MNRIPYPKYKLERIWQEGKAFAWDELKRQGQEQIKSLIENAILSELELFVGCGKYERGKERKDYRNGSYERLIATTLGELQIRFPRLRYKSFQSQFIKKYARRQQEVDYAVLNCFVLGGSVRKTKKICDLFIGVQISPSTVSKIAKKLSLKAWQFHHRKITSAYRFLIFDGLWIKVHDKYNKKKVMLFALGITADGQMEILDFMLADGETAWAYETLINHLIKRGLRVDTLDLIIHDGAKGLESALDICLPYTRRQNCIFHKIQGIASKLNSKFNRKAIMQDAGNVYKKANNKQKAIDNLKSFVVKWKRKEPRAVKCFMHRFDKTLTFFEFPASLRTMLCTSNLLERRLREIRRRTRPMGSFKNEKSVDRIIYALVHVINTGDVPSQFTQQS